MNYFEGIILMAISFDAYDISQVAAADTKQTTEGGLTEVAAGTTWQILNARAANESSAAEILTVHLPNPDAAAAAANIAVPPKTILAGKTDLLPEILGDIWIAGTALRTVTTTGLAINLKIGIMIRTT